MTGNPVGWFEIYVQDMERARKFYEAIVQTKLQKLESPEIEMWSFPMDREGTGAQRLLAAGEHTGSGLQVFFLQVFFAVDVKT